MTELTEFLLARIEDDFYKALDDFDKARAELRAMCRAIRLHRKTIRMPDRPLWKSWRGSYYEGSVAGCSTCGDGWPCNTLLALASTCTDHPDYRDEWCVES